MGRKNKIDFPKGDSLLELMRVYGTEEQSRKAQFQVV